MLRRKKGPLGRHSRQIFVQFSDPPSRVLLTSHRMSQSIYFSKLDSCQERFRSFNPEPAPEPELWTQISDSLTLTLPPVIPSCQTVFSGNTVNQATRIEDDLHAHAYVHPEYNLLCILAKGYRCVGACPGTLRTP